MKEKNEKQHKDNNHIRNKVTTQKIRNKIVLWCAGARKSYRVPVGKNEAMITAWMNMDDRASKYD